MNMLPVAVLSVGAVLAGVTLAQPATPPSPTPTVGPVTPSAPAAPDDAAAPSPPPPGPRADRRPPPPPAGPGVVVDREPGGAFHVDVRCPPHDAIRECATIATQMIDKLNGSVQEK